MVSYIDRQTEMAVNFWYLQLKGPGEEHVKSRSSYFSGEHSKVLEPYLGNKTT
jgi:hypothetical protein